jgi:transposase
MVHVGYHAHARRPFAELAKTHKITGLAHDAIRFYSKLYAVEMEARENQFTPDARHQLGQEKSVPILTALRKWLDHHLPKTSDQGTIGKAIRYCVGH